MATPRLMEPVYYVDILAPSDCIPAVYTVRYPLPLTLALTLTLTPILTLTLTLSLSLTLTLTLTLNLTLTPTLTRWCWRWRWASPATFATAGGTRGCALAARARGGCAGYSRRVTARKASL